MKSDTQLFIAIKEYEIRNIEWLRARGLATVSIPTIFDAFENGWVFCKYACTYCGAKQLIKNGEPHCLVCSGPLD